MAVKIHSWQYFFLSYETFKAGSFWVQWSGNKETQHSICDCLDLRVFEILK